MTATAKDPSEQLRQLVWNHFGEQTAWPNKKQIVLALDDLGIEVDAEDAWTAGVALRDRDDQEVTLRFAGLLLIPEARKLMEPLPALLRLACERYLSAPDYNDGPPKAEVTSEDFALLWPTREAGLSAAHLLFECRDSDLPFGGAGREGGREKIRLYPSLSILKYEKVQTLEGVLASPKWTPRQPDPKRLEGPHLALVQAVFAEGIAKRRWPVPLDFAVRHRQLGFVRDLVDGLHGRFLADDFSFSRHAKLSVTLAALPYLDSSGAIRASIPAVIQFFGERWKKLPADAHGYDATFDELLAATKIKPDILAATIMACWNEPWWSPQWSGAKGQTETLHLWGGKAAWTLRKVQTWDQYVAERRKISPHRVDDPDPSHVWTRADGGTPELSVAQLATLANQGVIALEDQDFAQRTGPTQEADARPADSMVGAGELIADRFEVKEQLGRGTRGYALGAVDRLTSRDVVCKLPLGDLVEGKDALLKQYEKLGLIRSYSVVQALGYFEHATSAGMVPVLVLERLHGTTLREWQPGKSLRERLGAIDQVVRTLAEMARIGLAHGDVHVDNALVEKEQVVLIDPDAESFGSVSKVVPIPLPQGTPVDFLPLKHLIRELIPEPELYKGIEPILAPLGKPDDIAGVLDALSAEIRARLALGKLPDEQQPGLSQRAVTWHARTANNAQLYSQIRKERDQAIRSFIQWVSERAESVGVKVEESGFTNAGVGETEAKTDDAERGSFYPRKLSMRGPDGDTWKIDFEGYDQFRKPWPNGRLGFLGLVRSSVYRLDEGTVDEPNIEIWSSGESVSLMFPRRTDGPARVDEAWIQRELEVLQGDRIQAVRIGPVPPPTSQAEDDLIDPSLEGPALAAHVVSLFTDHLQNRNMLAPAMEKVGGMELTTWHGFWALGRKDQHQHLRRVLNEMVKPVFDNVLAAVWRMDAVDLDPIRHEVRLDLDVDLRNGKRVETEFLVTIPV